MATAIATNHEEFPVRFIGLRSLRDENFIQCRVKNNIVHAQGITRFVLEKGHISEPIIVFDDGKNLIVADGIHRILGYREAARVNKRFNQIRAEIRPGTWSDALAYAAAANQTRTYLPRKPEDIKNAFFQLLDQPEWREKSATALGAHVAISSSRAKRYWIEYFSMRSLPVPSSVADTRGRVRPTITRQKKNGIFPKLSDHKHGYYRANVDGKTIRFGPDKEKAGEALADAMKAVELRKKRYELSHCILQEFQAECIHSNNIYGKGFQVPAGFHARLVDGIAITWEPFRNKSDVLAAYARACHARFVSGASRAVILCPVEDGPAELIEDFRKMGVEWMTIEDFVASLKADEDQADVEAARAALAEPGSIGLDDLKSELGLTPDDSA